MKPQTDAEDMVILGIGSYAVNIADIVASMNEWKTINNQEAPTFNIIGFIDPDTTKIGQRYFDFQVLGDFKWFENIRQKVNVVGIINREDRYQKVLELQNHPLIGFPNIIHPTAVISQKAKIGLGNIFAQGVIVAPECTIGNHNKINYGVVIAHHCHIGDFNVINGMVHITGSSTVGNRCMLGAGAVIIDNVTIADRVKVGANSLVRMDLPNNVTAVGSPARILPARNERGSTAL
jgi:sugar O-acyltransferase (sialic acid O-acetyltransferase NeuD family)